MLEQLFRLISKVLYRKSLIAVNEYNTTQSCKDNVLNSIVSIKGILFK